MEAQVDPPVKHRDLAAYMSEKYADGQNQDKILAEITSDPEAFEDALKDVYESEIKPSGKAYDAFKSQYLTDEGNPFEVKKKEESGPVSEPPAAPSPPSGDGAIKVPLAAPAQERSEAEHIFLDGALLPEVEVRPDGIDAPAGTVVGPDRHYAPGLIQWGELRDRFQYMDTVVPQSGKRKPGVADDISWGRAAIGKFNRDFYEIAPAVLETMAMGDKVLYDIYAAVSGDEEKKQVRDFATYQAAQYLRSQIHELNPMQADQENRWDMQIAGGVSQAIQFALAMPSTAAQVATLAPKAATATQAAHRAAQAMVNASFSRAAVAPAITIASSEFNEAKSKGASDAVAMNSALFNVVAGHGLEMMPLMNIFKRLDKVSGGGVVRVLKDGGFATFEEASTEVLQQTFSNINAKATYDKSRALTEGLKESGQTGGAVGFILQTSLSILTGRHRRSKSPAEQAHLQRSIDHLQQEINLLQQDHTLHMLHAPQPAQIDQTTTAMVAAAPTQELKVEQAEAAATRIEALDIEAEQLPAPLEPEAPRVDLAEATAEPDTTRTPDGQEADTVTEPVDNPVENQQVAETDTPVSKPDAHPVRVGNQDYLVNRDADGHVQVQYPDGTPVKKQSKHYKPAIEKYKQERIADFVQGKEAPLDNVQTEADYRSAILESENPAELAAEWDATPNDEIDYKAQVIKDNLRSTTQDSYARNGDLTGQEGRGQIRLNYIRPDGVPLDVQAQELSEIAGVEITEQDLVDFINANPNGKQTARAVNPHKDRVAQRFFQLTGLELDAEYAAQLRKAYLPEGDAVDAYLAGDPNLLGLLNQDELFEGPEGINERAVIDMIIASPDQFPGTYTLDDTNINALLNGPETQTNTAEPGTAPDPGAAPPAQPAEVSQQAAGQGPVGPPPLTPTVDEDTPKAKRLKIVDRVLESKKVPAKVKAALQKQNTGYIPKGLELSKEEASALIGALGEDLADAAVRDMGNGITGDTRVAVAAALFDSYSQQARAKGVAAADRAILREKLADITLFAARLTNSAGRTVNAAKLFKELLGASPEAAAIAVERSVADRQQAAVEPVQKEVKEAGKQVKETFEQAVAEAVKEVLGQPAPKTAPKKTDAKAKIKDFFDKLKIADTDTKGKLLDASSAMYYLTAKVYNASLDVIQKAIIKGWDVVQAVNAGADVIDRLQKGEPWSRNDYVQDMVSRLGNVVPQLKQEADVDSIADRVARQTLRHVSDSVASRDAVLLAVNSLMGKVRDLVKPGQKVPVTDLEKLAFAIEHRDELTTEWEEAMDLLVDRIMENKNLTEDEKIVILEKVNDAVNDNDPRMHAKVTARRIIKAQLGERTGLKGAALSKAIDDMALGLVNDKSTVAERINEEAWEVLDKMGWEKGPEAVRMYNAIKLAYQEEMQARQQRLLQDPAKATRKLLKDYLDRPDVQKHVTALAKGHFAEGAETRKALARKLFDDPELFLTPDEARDMADAIQQSVWDMQQKRKDALLDQVRTQIANRSMPAPEKKSLTDKALALVNLGAIDAGLLSDAMGLGDKAKKPPKETVASQLGRSVKNHEWLQQEWDAAKRFLTDAIDNSTTLTATEKSELRDKLFDKLQEEIPAVRREKLTDKAVKEQIRMDPDSQRIVTDLAKSYYATVETHRQNLAEQIASDTNLLFTAEEAQRLADAIQTSYDAMIQKKKDQILTQLEKRLNTPKVTGKKKKTLIEKALELSNLGALDEARWNELYAEALGIKPLSTQDKARIYALSEKVQQSYIAEKEYVSNPTPATKAEYEKKLHAAEIATVQLQEYMVKERSIADMVIALIQLNTLTLGTQTVNLAGNVTYQSLMRFPLHLGAVGFDMLIAAATRRPRTVAAPSQKGYFQGSVEGLRKGARELKTGAVDAGNLEQTRALHPIRAWRRLLSGQSDSKVNDFLEGTFGVPAEITGRMLNFTDKINNYAAATARAYELGRLQGLKGEALERFVLAPDPESQAEIAKAGREATFQESGPITKAMETGIKQFLDAVGEKVPVLKVVLKLPVLYTKVPSNLFADAMSVAFPPWNMYKAVKHLREGKQREASFDLSRMVYGSVIATLAYNLVAAGLLTPPGEKEDDARERQAGYTHSPQGGLNMSALWRLMTGGDGKPAKDDWVVSYASQGPLGILLGAYSSVFSGFREAGQETPEEKASFLDYLAEIPGMFPKIGAVAIQQPFAKGMADLLDGIRGSGSAGDRLISNYVATMSNAFYPATISAASRASSPYLADKKAEGWAQLLKNEMKTRTFRSEELPKTVNMWGEYVKRTPDGINPYFYLVDPFKSKFIDTEHFGYKVYELYKETGDVKFLPTAPPREISFEGFSQKLTPQQYESYARLVGASRAIIVRSLVTGPSWEKVPHDIKLKILKEAYDEGAEAGKMQMLMQLFSEQKK